MAKRKSLSKTKNIIACIICLIIGLFVGAFGNVYLSLPDSYTIPETTKSQSSAVTSSDFNVTEIANENFSVHFLELGNKYTGDCVLIKSGDTEMLIDAGSKQSSISTIKEYIDQFVTDGKIEYVVATHAHEDHIAGFATASGTNSLLEMYDIGTIIMFSQTNKVNGKDKLYTNFMTHVDNAERNGTSIILAGDHAKQTYTFADFSDESGISDITFTILDQKYYYAENVSDAKTENNFSVCIQFSQGSDNYLFTGDLEEKGETSLVKLNSGVLGHAKLYKAGHHGSKTSSSETLLSVIQPEIVCVCCCAGSSEYTSKDENQFPTQAFVDRVSVYTTQIYVTSFCIDYSTDSFTSMNGNIVVTSSGTGSDNAIKVYCSNNSDILCETEWFKTHRQSKNSA